MTLAFLYGVAVTLTALSLLALVGTWIFATLKRRARRRMVDARIVRQAKAAGVWDKKPIVLGGRALELKAWEDFKIKRIPGETDKELRRRYSITEMAIRKAEEQGLIRKGKTDGKTIDIILFDDTPPREGGR